MDLNSLAEEAVSKHTEDFYNKKKQRHTLVTSLTKNFSQLHDAIYNVDESVMVYSPNAEIEGNKFIHGIVAISEREWNDLQNGDVDDGSRFRLYMLGVSNITPSQSDCRIMLCTGYAELYPEDGKLQSGELSDLRLSVMSMEEAFKAVIEDYSVCHAYGITRIKME